MRYLPSVLTLFCLFLSLFHYSSSVSCLSSVSSTRPFIPSSVDAPAAASGLTPPDLPEEYSATIYQHKWNLNGGPGSVNHSYGGVYISSVASNKIRFDTSVQELVGDTKQFTVSQSQSLLIYSNSDPTKVINYFMFKDSFSVYSNCTLSFPNAAEVYRAPFTKDFLAKNQAIYYGEDYLPVMPPDRGLERLHRWVVFLPGPGSTVLTFFFDSSQSVVRYDIVSPVLQTAVVTYLATIYYFDRVPDVMFQPDPACHE